MSAVTALGGGENVLQGAGDGGSVATGGREVARCSAATGATGQGWGTRRIGQGCRQGCPAGRAPR